MRAVRCYGCGDHYTPTIEASVRHTNHAQAPQLVNLPDAYERVAMFMEQCQAERDTLVRELAATQGVRTTPELAPRRRRWWQR